MRVSAISVSSAGRTGPRPATASFPSSPSASFLASGRLGRTQQTTDREDQIIDERQDGDARVFEAGDLREGIRKRPLDP